MKLFYTSRVQQYNAIQYNRRHNSLLAARQRRLFQVCFNDDVLLFVREGEAASSSVSSDESEFGEDAVDGKNPLYFLHCISDFV